MAFITEDWANWSTTVSLGGYTSGSGVLNVANTSGVPSNNFSRVYIADQVTGAVKVILKVTAINTAGLSGQLAVTAEGSDASANAGDTVVSCLTVGAENAAIANANRFQPTTSGLPGVYDRKQGSTLNPSDDISRWVSDGSQWNAFGPSFPLVAPVAANFGWTNQGSGGAAASATVRQGSIFLFAPATSGDNLRLYEQAISASTPYSVTVVIQPNALMNFHGCGLYMRDNAGTPKLLTIGMGYNGSNYSINFNKWNSYTSFSATVFSSATGTWGQGTMALKVRNDGTNLYWSIGPNPFDLIEVAQGGSTTFLAANSFWGVWVDPNQSSIDANHPLGAGLTLLSWAIGT